MKTIIINYFWKDVIFESLKFSYTFLMVLSFQMFGISIFLKKSFWLSLFLGLVSILVLYMRDILHKKTYKEFWKIK